MQSFIWTSPDKEHRSNLAQEAKTEVSQFDLMIINCDEDGGIEAIRNLQSSLSRKPIQSPHNLAIVLEAQLLTIEAQNALLKTLEEPPQYSKIVLIASNVNQLLPTVLSRCHLQEATITTSQADLDKLFTISRKAPAERLKEIEGFDLAEWIQMWSAFLKQNLTDQQLTNQTHRYLKTLLRLSKYAESHVNSKLLASIALLNAPVLKN